MAAEPALVAAGAVAAAWLLWWGPSAGARLREDPPWRAPPWLRPHPEALGAGLRLSMGVLTGLVVLLAQGGLVGLVVGVLLGGGVHVGLGRLPTGAQGDRRRRLVAALPGACILLAVGVEAGMPLRNVVALVATSLDGPLAAELRRVDALVQLGVSDADAWRELLLGERDQLGAIAPELVPLAKALARSADSGTALAGMLRQQAADASRLARSRAEADARKVGVRTVLPLMLCFLPAFFLVGVVPIIGGVVSALLG
ncbi:MAG: type II secretion system F family protein [Micropruina sp.]|nr:type II secretion system F family protein [Micropruina sp.]